MNDAKPQPARRDGDRPFVLVHTFDAPRDRVWRAWTDRAELQRWFGPAGFTMPVCDLDLRPGGGCHYCLRSVDGAHEMWGRWTYRAIAAPERIELVQSFSDAAGGITTHPMAPTWPRETASTTTFTAEGGRTRMELRWTVADGTEEEHRTFDAAHDGMRQGWAGTIAQLAAHLSGKGA